MPVVDSLVVSGRGTMRVAGIPFPTRAAVTWADEGSAWARLRTEQVLYNGDLADYIGAAGP